LEWKKEVDQLFKNCLSKQLLMHLLRTCLQYKCNYLLSAIPPDLTYDMAESFHIILSMVMLYILTDSTVLPAPDSELLGERIWQQYYLKCADGGFGLMNPVMSRYTLYLI
jgi:hypothetical protein